MTKKLFIAILVLLLVAGCSALSNGNEISGPTVEPPIPSSGSVLFQDKFDDPSSGWEHVNDASGIMDYDNGVYRIVVNQGNTNAWATPGKSYRDSRVEVDAVKIGGPDSNRAGIVCRVNGGDLYFFVISNDGYYGIGRTLNGQSVLLGQTAFAQSSAIKPGLAINHLRADCVGSTLSFYVNGFLVGQAIDTTLTGGEIGLIAGTFSEANVDIVFDEFIVLQP
jgi:hypothetical protein